MIKAKKTKTKSSKKEAEEKKSEKITREQFEKRVIELGKDGLTSEKIGEELRKNRIHSKEYGKKISKILKENGLYIIPDLKNMEEKIKKIEDHIQKNKQDKRAIRERSRIFSKIKGIKKHNKIE